MGKAGLIGVCSALRFSVTFRRARRSQSQGAPCPHRPRQSPQEHQPHPKRHHTGWVLRRSRRLSP